MSIRHRPPSLKPWSLGPLLAVALLLLVPLIAAGCGGDDDDEGGNVSAADLSDRLAPAQELRLGKSERQFEWEEATDFIVEGVFRSEGTTPSELIDKIEEEGFAAAAGEVLHGKDPFTHLSVAAFDSEAGAEGARDVLHEEDLKQPCFAACAVNPVEHTVDAVPNSVAVHQVPIEGKLPPDLFKFERYLIEFTIGSDLYVLQMDFPAGAVSEADFERAASAVYEHAAAQG